MKYFIFLLIASSTLCVGFRRERLKASVQNTPSGNLLPSLDKTSFNGEKSLKFAQFGYDFTYWPVFTMHFGWDANKDKSSKSFFLVSQNSPSFAVTNTFGFECNVSNFCISTETYDAVNYGVQSTNTFKYNILKVNRSAETIYTTFSDDKKIADTIFQVSTGTVTDIKSATKKMDKNWPFNAGIMGLKPGSKFFDYVYQSAKIDKEFIMSLKYSYNNDDNLDRSYWDIDPVNTNIDDIISYQSSISFNGHIENEPHFWIKAEPNQPYFFPNGHFASTNKDKWQISSDYGKVCIVSDMSQYFMIHKNGDAINKGLAKLACNEDDISQCKAITKPSLENIDDFYLNLYETRTNLHDNPQRIKFSVDKLLYKNKEGDLVSGVASNIFNIVNDAYLFNYGCPFDTVMILGQKFLTLQAFTMKLVPGDQSDLHSIDYDLYFGIEDDGSGGLAWWAILLIVLGCILLLLLISWIIWLVIKNKKKSDGSEKSSGSEKPFVNASKSSQPKCQDADMNLNDNHSNKRKSNIDKSSLKTKREDDYNKMENIDLGSGGAGNNLQSNNAAYDNLANQNYGEETKLGGVRLND